MMLDENVFLDSRGKYGVTYQSYPSKVNRLSIQACPDSKIVLNVGGMKSEVLWKTLAGLPNTRLGKLQFCRTDADLSDLCNTFDTFKNEFYFDRNPKSFATILNFYRTGKLHFPEDMCATEFNDDLNYWRISDSYISLCCQRKYHQKRDFIEEEVKKEMFVEEVEDWEFSGRRIPYYQKLLWNLFENPTSSMAAKVLAFYTILLTSISLAGLCISTIKEFEEFDKNFGGLFVVESICIAWFTLELLLRFISSSSKWKFSKDLFNIIDMIAIIPYYISLIMLAFESSSDSFSEAKRIVQIFRVLRMLRIFKLARHSAGLQTLGTTLRNSWRELCLLLSFLSIGVLFFSSLIFFTEDEVEMTPYTSIPASFWWAIVSMTTVGYGDMVPSTLLGKVIGTCCLISGVLMVSLPVPIIANNFQEAYTKRMEQERLTKLRSKSFRSQISLNSTEKN